MLICSLHPQRGFTYIMQKKIQKLIEKNSECDETTSLLMTKGPIKKKIIAFALPIFWGNLFQQLYNIVDSLVVGNFAGRDALAAVSSSGPLIFLMVGLFSGIYMGAGVVISKYYGGRDEEKVQIAIHTSVAFGVASSVVLSIVGAILTPQILKLMNTPDSVIDNSVLYFRIYFLGISGVILYNTASGIFQAIGDSKHPLHYLIIGSIINVVLDLIFVAVFKWSVAGAALATVISQLVSAFLAFSYLCKTKEIYKVDLKKARFQRQMLKQLLIMGIPTGLQNSVISIANIVVQANINVFGSMAVAGCGSHTKLEGFAFIPITSFAFSLTTYISQNLGAREYERAKKGACFGIITCITISEIIGLLYFVFAPQLISCFNSDPTVVAFGTLQGRTEALFFFLLAFSHCMAGVFRGAGKAIIPMLVMLACWCVIRVSYITMALQFFPTIQTIFWAYPITWSLSSIIFLAYYIKADWVHGFESKIYQ